MLPRHARSRSPIRARLHGVYPCVRYSSVTTLQISQKEITAYLSDAEAKPGLRNFAKPQCIRWQPKPIVAKPSKR
jgi:hypothetical protein